MTEERKVDWGRPIEAVHTDGTTQRVTVVQSTETRVQISPAVGGCWWFNLDGSHDGTAYWRIRNVPANSQAPTLPDDLTARMVAFIKRCAAWDGSFALVCDLIEARAIVAEMEPVDEHEAYADALLKQQGWHGEPSIGFAAVARMIATAHEDGRALERGEGK